MLVLNVLWVLGLLIIAVKGAKYNCNVNASNGDQYDFTALNKDGGWSIRDVSDAPDDVFQDYFKFNFCEDLTTNCTSPTQVGAYHEAFFQNTILGSCTNYGTAENVRVEVSTIEKKTAINVTYLQGDLCMYIENLNFVSKPRKSTFLIYCGDDSNASWTQTKYDGGEITDCTPQFVLYHPSGCPVNQTGGWFWKLMRYLIYALIFVGCLVLLFSYLENKGQEGRQHFTCWKSMTSSFSACLQSGKAMVDRVMSKVKKSSGGRRQLPSPLPVKYEVI